MNRYWESDAIGGTRATAQNILMTCVKLFFFLSDSSSSSRVPSSSWNNHKLTRVLAAERQCGSVHGDPNIPCSSTTPEQSAECSMIPWREKAFCLCFALIRMCRPVRANILQNDPKRLSFSVGFTLHFTTASGSLTQQVKQRVRGKTLWFFVFSNDFRLFLTVFRGGEEAALLPQQSAQKRLRFKHFPTGTKTQDVTVVWQPLQLLKRSP